MRARRATATVESRRTVAYVRVSTQDQAVEGVSLAAQEARIGSYCAAMGWPVSEVIRDAGESGKSLQRRGMLNVLAGLRAGTIGRVVALKLDRLTRSTRDLAELLEVFAKADASLVSVEESLDTSSASGRLILNIMGSVSQWEREAIAERTAMALAHKRQRRTAYGATPFGYVRIGDALVPEQREQAALEEAVRLDRDGASFRQIAKRLGEIGVMPHRGKAWHASSVRAMLRSRIVTETRACA